MSNGYDIATTFFKYTILVVTGICLFGAILNEGRLYGRYKNNNCVRGGVFELSTSWSEMCCEGYHADDWVCLASHDKIERLLTKGAWILPLVPLFLPMIWGFAVNDIPDNLPVLFRRRIGYYLMLFSYRTV